MAIELRPDLAELTMLTECLEHFGEEHGLAPAIVSTMNLALEEAVSNVIGYGFDEGDTPVIKIRLAHEPGCLTASLEDNGRAFDPLQAPLPDTTTPLEQRQIGGLGITLIRKLMDEVRYSREGSRNVLVLRKHTG
jgi:anti-sigma regulatory factor (Ser/Thr protein kinase)